MNESDSERIASLLNSLGLKPAPENKADLIIINACSVRQSAVDRIYGKIKVWSESPKKKKIILTGCVLIDDRKKLAPKVDLIFNIKDLNKLPGYLKKIYNKKFIIHNSRFIVHNSKFPALVPIMTGCNHFCTYCAVPYTRGREVSRPEKEIICEVKKAVENGTKEIILLGQNVNRYGKSQITNSKFQINSKKQNSKSQTTSFVKLLKKLVKIPGNFQIKFISANPWDFSQELINLIAKEPKMSKYIHLPVQSGDDEILKKMNRPYSAKKYLDLVKKLRAQIPNLYLSTDIIVGFPGETKKAFQNTVKLCKKAKFNKAYLAQYSPRPGTAAAKLKNTVPRQEKKQRWEILNNLINK
jgi:tRNA-2-methylthio-N6-dimethylallyladenosine synthase